jgi:RNA polymerase sigma-70 factor, ECF subfamily
VPAPESTEITRLLHDAGAGRAEAADLLLERVYDQLKRIAALRMAGEKPGHTLQATALVNEAYLRLIGPSQIDWRNRGQFYGAAAEAMRKILIDHARKKGAVKRGGGGVGLDTAIEGNDVHKPAVRKRLAIELASVVADEDPGDFLALDEAIVRLKEVDARAADVTRLRFFAGLSVEQTAEALDIAPRTVKRDWEFARAWLYQQLRESGDQEK